MDNKEVSVMYYTAQSGDSLYTISMQHKTTLQHLIDINPQISNPNMIRVGEKIEVGNPWVLNPWRGNEWRMGMEEYQKGIEEYRKGRAEYRKGRKEQLKYKKR